MANGLSRYGARPEPRASTKSLRLVKGGSFTRAPLPGSCTAHTSTLSGRPSGHARNIDSPPPAYGKHRRRIMALGFGLRAASHGFLSAISRLALYSIMKAITKLHPYLSRCDPVHSAQ